MYSEILPQSNKLPMDQETGSFNQGYVVVSLLLVRLAGVKNNYLRLNHWS